MSDEVGEAPENETAETARARPGVADAGGPSAFLLS